LLTSEYPPFFGGGIGTYCYQTAGMLAANGHNITVFVNDARVSGRAITEEGNIRIIRFNPSQTRSSSFLGHVTNISYEFAYVVKQTIEEEGQPDIIEAQEYLGIAYYLLQFKKLLYDWCRDVPVLITAHSPSFLYLEFNHVSLYKYPNFWIGEMERFCLQAADHLISPSNYLIDEMAKRFDFISESRSIVRNPFQTTNASASPVDEGNGQIVFYGKLSAQKGIFKLLNYFELLWEKGFDKPLYVIGGVDIVYHPMGKTMGDVVEQQYRKYIDKGLLIIEGKIAPQAIERRLSSSRVVIIPSTVDNLPYVVLEMMALGTIVLVSKQGGQAEIVRDGFNGFVFDHDEPESFSRQLNKILSLDREVVNNIGNNARKTILNDFAFAAIYPQKIKVVEECVANAKTRRTRFPFTSGKDDAVLKGIETGNGIFTKGLLSVVVPYYNMGQYIDETVASLRASRFSFMEIIIVNDGSTDKDSILKLQEYRDKEGIVIIDRENQGLANTRNFGALNAKGEFLAFLDADDKIAPAFYENAIEVFRRYENVYFAGAWTRYFGGSGRTWPTVTPEAPLILYHNTIDSSALVYKRDAFLAGGLNDPDMAFKGLEDYDSVISLVSKGFNGVVFPETMFYYRVRHNSMIRSVNRAQKLVLQEYIANKNKAFYAKFASSLFNLLNANGPAINLDNPTLDYDLLDKVPFGGRLSRMVISLVKKNRHVKTIAYKIYRVFNK